MFTFKKRNSKKDEKVTFVIMKWEKNTNDWRKYMQLRKFRKTAMVIAVTKIYRWGCFK